jgi:hypothetical protein
MPDDLPGIMMSTCQETVACPRCGCAAIHEAYYRAGTRTLDCTVCGYWGDFGDETREGGGYGVVAHDGELGSVWGPLAEGGDAKEMFKDDLESLEWVWFSRPVGDGRWEGVALKGTPPDSYPVGIIPLFVADALPAIYRFPPPNDDDFPF